MELIWVIVIVWAVWYFTKKHSNKSAVEQVQVQDEKPRNVTEEEVLAMQTKFEKRLDEQVDFPDGIRYTTVYIYKKLMRSWYSDLVSKYRYDDQMIQKLRNDWVDYMHLLESNARTSYLWMENEGEKAEEYKERAINSSRKYFAIEDAFAQYLGEEKVKELAYVRSLDESKINKKGELAPEGKEFTIFGDLIDESPDEAK
jgi:hypothetical protein